MAIAATIALLAAQADGGAMDKQDAVRSTDLPRARDPDAAVREELDAARRAATPAAYDLFLARHPRHRFAEIARAERAALAAKTAE